LPGNQRYAFYLYFTLIEIDTSKSKEKTMKISKAVVFAVFLAVLLFSCFMFAQQKPAPAAAPARQVYAVLDLVLKPGMGWEWESYLKRDLIPVAKKAGTTQLLISKSDQFGVSDRYMIMWPLKSLAELDSPSPIEKALGLDGALLLQTQLQRCVERSRMFSFFTHPELGINAKQGYEHKMGVMVTITVAPGRKDEFEKMSKDMLSVFAKTNAKAVYVGNIGLGGNPNQYMTSIFVDSYADLEQFLVAYTKAIAEAKISPAGVVTSMESQAFKTLPGLSIE
jgi:hypothetical protein